MITEDQVWKILVESNPMPESDPQEAPDLDATAYLPTIQQRSSEVTQLDSTKTETEKGRTAKFLVAAAVLLVAGLGIFLAVREPQGPPVVTQPIPVPTSEATTTTAPEASLTPGETIEAAIAAYNAHDLDTLMTYFSDTSFISAIAVPTETATGPASIRINFSVALDFAPDENSITISNLAVDGDRVTWDQVELRDGLDDRCGEHVAIVRDGKIERWDWPTEDLSCP